MRKTFAEHRLDLKNKEENLLTRAVLQAKLYMDKADQTGSVTIAGYDYDVELEPLGNSNDQYAIYVEGRMEFSGSWSQVVNELAKRYVKI